MVITIEDTIENISIELVMIALDTLESTNYSIFNDTLASLTSFLIRHAFILQCIEKALFHIKSHNYNKYISLFRKSM